MTPYQFDIVIFGAGIAGLWLGNVLKRMGYNVIIIENDRIGGGQTLASQGMIHGGQKYLSPDKTSAIASMPERWEAALGGWGDIDLTGVEVLSEHQVMWPAGSVLSEAAVFGAARLVNTQTEKIGRDDWPEILRGMKKFKGTVYRLPEKVLDTRSLLLMLMKKLKGRILKGEVSEILPDGQVAVNGLALRAQLVIFTAGAGNERALELLRVRERKTQRRPLRQVMVRGDLPALFGHGITTAPKPRLTVTTHKTQEGIPVWYIGGNIAEKGAEMDEAATVNFAKSELFDVFPDIDWEGMDWATWAGDRAEPFSAEGGLPPGPFLHQRGKILLAWPSKLTFAPGLADHVLGWLRDKDIMPSATDKPPSELQTADIGLYPWETAVWRKAAS